MRKILSLLVVFAIAFQVSTALPAPEPQILQYFQSTFNAIANLGTNLLTPIRTSLTNLVNGLISTLASLGQTIASTVNPLQTIPEDVIEAALELLNAKGELIQGSLETIVDGLNLTAASIPSLGNLASGIQDALQSLPAAISANIAQPLSNIIETLANASANPDLSSIIGPLTEAVEQALSPLGNLANATAANIASNFVAAFQNIGPVINNFLTQATSLVNNDAAAQVLTQLVKNLEDLVKGVVTSADQLSNAVQKILLDIARRAQQVALDINTALNNAVSFVTGKAAEAATAIRNTFTDALSRLSGLRSVASTALNGAKAIAGAFNNTLNAFGLQARAIQADLANFVTALNTSATNAYAQIEAASANLTAAINKAVANANTQLTNLYTGLQADIVAAMNSGSAKAIACATIARDAIVANTQTAGNAIATCSASARSNANTASDAALTGLAAQFNIASTANANVANCITNYNTNKEAVTGATCLVSVGVNALRAASTTAINTLMTTFTATVNGIAATTQTCTSAALAAAQAQASTTNAAFQQCLNA